MYCPLSICYSFLFSIIYIYTHIYTVCTCIYVFEYVHYLQFTSTVSNRFFSHPPAPFRKSVCSRKMIGLHCSIKNKQTNKQTSKQTNKQTNQPTNQPTSLLNNKHESPWKCQAIEDTKLQPLARLATVALCWMIRACRFLNQFEPREY